MSIRNKKRKSPAALRSRKNHQAIAYDVLEPKLPLTSFVVTSLSGTSVDGDGQLTLAEAIQAANTNTASADAPAGEADGDVIQFDPSLDGLTLNLPAELTISDDLMIQGGELGITIDGNGSRIFNIPTSEDVTLGGLTLTGGSADQGGAISSTGGGKLLVANMTFTNNTATSDSEGGGAIYRGDAVIPDGVLIVSNSVFDGNVANGTSGSGGAIYSESGNILVVDSEFYSNVANRAGGAFEVVDGAIRIFDTTVGEEGRGNVAGPDDTANPGNGGGLHISGVARTVVDGGSFTANIAGLEGGGLWNQVGSTMVIRNSATISDNVAEGAGADDGGGGIFNNGGDVLVTNSQISGNTASGAAGSGGGLFSTDGRVVFDNSLVIDNSAARAGGGVEVIDGSLLFSSTSVDANDVGIDVTAAPGNGGGLHISGVARTVIDDSSFSDNVAAQEGGGVWNQVGSTMLIRNGSEINRNSANGDDADDGGGGVFNNGGRVFIADSTIANNEADGAAGSGGGIFSTAGVVRANGSTISRNSAARAGGGVEVIDGRIALIDSLLNGNDAGVNVTAAPGNGGGLHVTGAEAVVLIDGTRVIGNTAANEGGGLWNQTGSRMVVRNDSRISTNTAIGEASTTEGGGIYNKGQLLLTDTIFAQNSSTGVGGGLVVTDTGFAAVGESRFNDNTAGTDGGGVYVDGRARITDNVFAGNTASGDGGGIFETFAGRTFQDGNTFSSNTPNDTAQATA